MPIGFDLWEDGFARKQIKAVFVNRMNWYRFCAIASQLAASVFLKQI